MKVNLGNSELKKSYFPISFDSSTTTNFGEVIPTFCKEIVAKSNVSIDLRSAVRFAPLSLPTFGKAFLHNYGFYHKFSDLWHPFESMQTQTPFVYSDGTTSIPTGAPSLPLYFFWLSVLCHSSWSAWKLTDNFDSSLSSDSPLKVDTFSVSPLFVSAEYERYISNAIVFSLLNAIPDSSSSTSFAGGILANISPNSRSNMFIYPNGDYRATFSPSSFHSSKFDASVDSFDLGPHAVTPSGSDFMVKLSGQQIMSLNSNGGLFPASSLSNSPFVSTGSYLLCFKLNYSGKLLRKIFQGLGYKIINHPKKVNVLPLFAYAKSYYDLFAPKRYLTWDMTPFGSLLKILNTNPYSLEFIFANSHYSSPFDGASKLIDALLSCFYTENTDYYSSQIIGMVNEFGGSVGQSYLGVDLNGNVDQFEVDQHGSSAPALNLNDVQHTQSQQNILSRLTSFINRRSVAGGKIYDLLSSVFGISKNEVVDERPYIGSNVLDVEFNDVFSTAETSEGSLGEYAGKALAFGSFDNISVDCKSPGVILFLSTIVPRTQKVQGVDPNLFHVHYSDFYNPLYDGLTLLPTSKLGLYAVDSFNNDPDVDSQSFGNQSLYAEYKTSTQGVLNGDLSLLSTKSSFDSFTMDQVFADYVSSSELSGGQIQCVRYSPSLRNMSAGTMWRYVGRWLWLGNFDRIFVNTRQFFSTVYDDYSNMTWTSRDTHLIDDNLVVHNVVNLKINAPMLPLAQSYMTQDIEDLYNSDGITIQSE